MEKELIFHNKEFEKCVRNELLINDRPIYVSDALGVYDLDLSEFCFDIEDCETLTLFKNLDRLDINIRFKDISFLTSLAELTELTIEYYGSEFDFKYLSAFEKLRELTVSGGDWSTMKLANLEYIADVESLNSLCLHEFGYVDLRPLGKMQHLKNFYCAYGDNVVNYKSIGKLKNLEGLTLIDFPMDSIEFLKELPCETMYLGVSGIDFDEEIDTEIFNRFKEKSIEIRINGELFIIENL